MPNDCPSKPQIETFTWLQPGTWRKKAEARHLIYSDVPTSSQRYRFVALNEMGRMMVNMV